MILRKVIARPLYYVGCALYDAGEFLLTLAARLDGKLDGWQ